MSIFKDGDRIIVEKSLYGVYDGKKGTVKRSISEELVEVILDINKGTVNEITIFRSDSIKIDPFCIASVASAKEASEGIKTILGEMSSVDDRMDNLESILGKYGLSVKDSCGFMYIYDFIDTLSNAWSSISEEDRENISLCLLGEKV